MCSKTKRQFRVVEDGKEGEVEGKSSVCCGKSSVTTDALAKWGTVVMRLIVNMVSLSNVDTTQLETQ